MSERMARAAGLSVVTEAAMRAAETVGRVVDAGWRGTWAVHDMRETGGAVRVRAERLDGGEHERRAGWFPWSMLAGCEVVA